MSRFFAIVLIWASVLGVFLHYAVGELTVFVLAAIALALLDLHPRPHMGTRLATWLDRYGPQ